MSDQHAIDRDAPIAIHAQISEHIRNRIATGDWPAHYRLKSEPDLAAELGVSRGTLRRALTTLIEEGLLRQVRGRGTFVTSMTFEPSIAQRLSTLSEDFANQGVVFDTEVRAKEAIGPPRPVAALLDVPVGGEVLRLSRLRSTAGEPVTMLTNYVRLDLTPGIIDTDFAEESLFGTLEGRYGLKIGTARRTFSAEAADDEIAAALRISPGQPVQYMQQVTYLVDGRPIEYSDVWIHSGRLKVTSLLSRR
ncbi:GntR family transcriptional regulator [Microbacterium esteraromaticum]|uniref:GntR family transcriptional regulator n=1 Tax=Microbacterium esteraromaticum TaxID=57043 RepID=UPI001D4690BB|nr:GntR family transcriptional regulator [Microbacterium esteraromaticum]MBM7466239.1 DNA-binding GntR family transcriptional regulator [Microbacterium esteraromaticum]